jgi:putative acetyltransferase
MRLRAYRPADLESVVLLFADSVHTLAHGHYGAVQLAAWAPPPDPSEWRRRLATLRTLVAEDGRGLAGFLSYRREGRIELLYVAPRSARQGVATRLYVRAEHALLAAGVPEVVTEASLVARPFFERQGFVVAEAETLVRRGVAFRRFAMQKSLSP